MTARRLRAGGEPKWRQNTWMQVAALRYLGFQGLVESDESAKSCGENGRFLPQGRGSFARRLLAARRYLEVGEGAWALSQAWRVGAEVWSMCRIPSISTGMAG